jgi:hypothetical protein
MCGDRCALDLANLDGQVQLLDSSDKPTGDCASSCVEVLIFPHGIHPCTQPIDVGRDRLIIIVKSDTFGKPLCAATGIT